MNAKREERIEEFNALMEEDFFNKNNLVLPDEITEDFKELIGAVMEHGYEICKELVRYDII